MWIMKTIISREGTKYLIHRFLVTCHMYSVTYRMSGVTSHSPPDNVVGTVGGGSVYTVIQFIQSHQECMESHRKLQTIACLKHPLSLQVQGHIRPKVNHQC